MADVSSEACSGKQMDESTTQSLYGARPVQGDLRVCLGWKVLLAKLPKHFAKTVFQCFISRELLHFLLSICRSAGTPVDPAELIVSHSIRRIVPHGIFEQR